MTESTSPIREVVIVDASVSDWKTLTAGINPNIPVILLPSGGNGLESIADALSSYGTLDAVHLVSHGGTGRLSLGDLQLTSNNLAAQSDALSAIASHLTPDSDLLLYGCSVAAGDNGHAFVDALSSALNGADITASTDRTGPLSLGGDWDLEYAVGNIETVLPFTVQGMQGIDECLGCVGNQYYTNGGMPDPSKDSQCSGDSTAPTVNSISSSNSASATSATFSVVFSESVQNVNASDFTLVTSGSASGTISSLSGSGSTYSLIVNSITGSGTIQINLKSSGTGIQDTSSNHNAISGGFTGTAHTVTIAAAPTLTSATYDASTGTLVVTGANMTTGDTIDVSKLTLTGEGGTTRTLTSGNVTASSSTAFSVTLNATDQAAVQLILNKNGTTSTSGTNFNLAGAANWDSTASAAADLTGNGVTVSNVAVPTITSATYDANTGALVVTGTGFLSKSGATNDIVANKFSFTGEGGSTYTLTDSSNVEITSGTSFTLSLSATDKAAINQVLNKNGTSSSSGTTYNLAAAEDWAAGADAAVVVADTTSNGITVSNVAAPTITSATYNASTGTLVVTGTGFLSSAGATNDIVANKFTLTGEGGSTYTLTDSSNVEITSGTSFTLSLSATDKAAINQVLNKNGTSSSGGTTYNLAAAEDWAAGADAAVVVADTTGNGITVSNVAVPTITSATYDASTGALVVTGTGFLKLSGATNDIVANKFTFTGEGGSTYTLTDSSNVEITSGTSFTLSLSATDKSTLNQIINKNGTSSSGATTYNLAAAEDWAAGADAAVVVADTTGNGITVSNVAVPAITSTTYDANTGELVVTGTGFLKLSGATNDIVANKFTFTGEGGSTYTLTDSSNVDITSGTSFTLTLSATDKAAINELLNKNGTSSTDSTTYNLAAAEDWAAGADAAVFVADATGNGITVSNYNALPTIANLNADSVTWAGVGNTVVLDAGTNTSLNDAELSALNGGNGDWAGGSLTVQHTGAAVSADVFDFNTSGAPFTVSGSNLQAGGLTFATFSNGAGVLTINFTSSGTAATTELVNAVAQSILYRNDTPAGDANLRFTLSDGTGSTTADVTVNSDTIYVTNTTDTATIDVSNGVSFSEAVAIAAADNTGSQTLILGSAFASTGTTLAGNVSISESLTVNTDAVDSGTTLAGNQITLGSGTVLTVTNQAGKTSTISSVLAGSGGLTKTGAGTLTLSGANTYTGTTTVSAGGLTTGTANVIADTSAVSVASGATLTLGGNETVGSLAGAGTVALGANTLTTGGGNASTTFSGVISGSGGVTKTGAGTFTLLGSNTYIGTTSVSSGTLSIAADANLGAGTVSLASGTALDITDTTTVDNALDLSGAGYATLDVATGRTATLSGQISGAQKLYLSQAGTVVLSNTGNEAAWSGDIEVRQGTLSVASDDALSSGSLQLNNGAFSISGTTTIDNAIQLLNSATVQTSDNVTLSGAITNGGGLTKAGSGSITLAHSGIVADAGATTVTAGTLALQGDANNTLTGYDGQITVSSGASLAGSDWLNDTLTIASGGKLTLGVTGTNDGVGHFTIDSGANLVVGGTLEMNAAGASSYDQIVVQNGAVTLTGSTLSFTLKTGYVPTVGDHLTLIDNQGSSAVVGTFSGLAEGSTLTAGGASFQISYVGGTGNDVVLTRLAPPADPPTPTVPTPQPPPVEQDNDGVSPTIEDAAPGLPISSGNNTPVAGDGNGDGIKDSTQSQVTSVVFLNTPTAVSKPATAQPVYVTLVASSQDGKVDTSTPAASATTLNNVKQLDAPTDLPSAITMPLGLISFSANVGAASTTESFSLYVDPTLGVNGYWKKNAAGTWVNLASEAYGGKTVNEGGKLRLDFQLKDGGEFDADGRADGVITDPGAAAYMQLSIVGIQADQPASGFWF
ncbi:DUF4347 domain-containing protein [Zoogloea sp. LCSB751]|uniref:DUF4347 domain-containing protein n=1 Tax=Zoogloea sp. LCSB751 TaxID=1965277 RepID=UPI0009A4C141|nr:DUF4347 domain-containing protein [Zoogloea sp. LCSB751]